MNCSGTRGYNNIFIHYERRDMYRYISLQFQDLGSYEGHLPPKRFGCPLILSKIIVREEAPRKAMSILNHSSSMVFRFWLADIMVKTSSAGSKYPNQGKGYWSFGGYLRYKRVWYVDATLNVCNFSVRTCPVYHYHIRPRWTDSIPKLMRRSMLYDWSQKAIVFTADMLKHWSSFMTREVTRPLLKGLAKYTDTKKNGRIY